MWLTGSLGFYLEEDWILRVWFWPVTLCIITSSGLLPALHVAGGNPDLQQPPLAEASSPALSQSPTWPQGQTLQSRASVISSAPGTGLDSTKCTQS